MVEEKPFLNPSLTIQDVALSIIGALFFENISDANFQRTCSFFKGY